MPGTILDVKVNVGDTVENGQVLLILEAMKMENEIMAPAGGKVVAINASKGASVSAGDVLVVLG
jgi:biotin carboxyl carrier protein